MKNGRSIIQVGDLSSGVIACVGQNSLIYCILRLYPCLKMGKEESLKY